MCDFNQFWKHSKKIVCVGRNYAKHVKELGNEMPEKPIFFIKPTTAYITSGEKIVTPPGCVDLQHEVELGIVIGKHGKNIPEERAMEWIQGYVLALDMTARDEQRKAKAAGVPWTLAKIFGWKLMVLQDSNPIPNILFSGLNGFCLMCRSS